MGLFETDGAAYPLIGVQASIVAAYLDARMRNPAAASRFDELRRSARPDLRGGRPYVDSLRHEHYVRNDVYARELKRACELLACGS
jgi:hypothetical protein